MARRRMPLAGLALLLCAVTGVAFAGPRAVTLERLRSILDEAQEALEAGRLEEAETLFGQARAESSALGPSSLPLARGTDGLADVYRRTGREAEAAPLYEQSAALWESLLGPRQPRLATTLHNLGAVRLAMSRPDLAEPPLRRALEIWKATLGAQSSQARNTERLWQRARRSGTGKRDG